MVDQAELDNLRKCPVCAEFIKKKAVLCKYCNSTMSSDSQQESNRSYNRLQADDKGLELYDRLDTTPWMLGLLAFWAIVIISGICIGAWFSMSSHKNQPDAATVPLQADTSATEPTETNSGQTVQLDVSRKDFSSGLTYTIERMVLRSTVGRTGSSYGGTATPNSTYLVIYFKVRNDSNEKHYGEPEDRLQMIAGDGKRYDPDSDGKIAVRQEENNWSKGWAFFELPQDVEKESIVVFQVPLNQLKNHPQLLVGDTMEPVELDPSQARNATQQAQDNSASQTQQAQSTDATQENYVDNTAATSSLSEASPSPMPTPSCSSKGNFAPASVPAIGTGPIIAGTSGLTPMPTPTAKPMPMPADGSQSPDIASPSSQTDYTKDSASSIAKLLQAECNGDDTAINQIISSLDTNPKPMPGDSTVATRLNKIGLKHLKDKNYNEALKYFGWAANADPSDPKYLSNLGFAEMNAGDLHSAKDHLYASIALAPSRSVAWGDLGEILAKQRDKDKAVACFLIGYKVSGGDTLGFLQSLKTDDDPAIREAGDLALVKVATIAKLGSL